MWSFSAPELKMNRPVSVCWQQYGWPHGTRSWTLGSTSFWGRPSWGRSSCCFTAAGVQSFTPSTAGSAARSAARGSQANLIASATADSPCQTLPSNPSPELWPERFDLKRKQDQDVEEFTCHWLTTQAAVQFCSEWRCILTSHWESSLFHKWLRTKLSEIFSAQKTFWRIVSTICCSSEA